MIDVAQHLVKSNTSRQGRRRKSAAEAEAVEIAAIAAEKARQSALLEAVMSR